MVAMASHASFAMLLSATVTIISSGTADTNTSSAIMSS
jgi:hypothetical protein